MALLDFYCPNQPKCYYSWAVLKEYCFCINKETSTMQVFYRINVVFVARCLEMSKGRGLPLLKNKAHQYFDHQDKVINNAMYNHLKCKKH